MAIVFRAEDTTLRREVALKLLYPQLVRREDLSGRFLREARAAAALDHPNILKVFDVGEDADTPFIVMELVRGRSLKEFLDAHGAPLAEIVALAGQVLAETLHAAHEAGVVHRDVKPANVMIADGGRLVLCDFGVARLAHDDAVVTQSGVMLGTPAFMSPEQALGRAVDARSDVYSLGATLYQLATGALPFSGPTPAVLAAVARGELVSPLRRNPAMGAPLAKVIERAMAKEPEARWASAAELAAALAAVARGAGLEDAAAELGAYFADPGEWNREATPKIVAAQVARAREAVSRREYAKALALCDRVLALQPDHAEASSIVGAVGRGAREWRKRVVLAGALAAFALAAVAGVAVVKGRRRPPRLAASPPAATASADAGAGDRAAAVVPDAATGRGRGGRSEDGGRDGDGGGVAIVPPAAAADAGPPRGAAPGRPGRPGRPSPDADPDVARATVTTAAGPPDAGAAREPRPAPGDAARTGRLIVKVRGWCDLSIDGASHGRARAQPIELPAGDHHVVCAQSSTGLRHEERVAIRPGEDTVLEVRLVPEVAVSVDVPDHEVRVDGVARAGTFRLSSGRHLVELYQKGRLVHRTWLAFPTRDCTLRITPALNCY